LGIRAIERVTGHHRDTVSRVLRDVADYAGALNEEVLRNIAAGTFETDELWTMVEKREAYPRGLEKGRQWGDRCLRLR